MCSVNVEGCTQFWLKSTIIIVGLVKSAQSALELGKSVWKMDKSSNKVRNSNNKFSAKMISLLNSQIPKYQCIHKQPAN